MYSEKKITDLASEVFQLWKKVNTNYNVKRKDYKEICPEYWEGYHLACSYAEHIETHAVVGKFPEKLFKERSPNQTEKEQKYIRDTYKQITLPVFVDYVSTITRGDNANNESIDYQPDAPQYEGELSLQEYLEHDIKDYGSLEVWRKNVLPSIKSVDANGIIVVKPYFIPTINPEEDTEEVMDPDKLLEPLPFYYKVKDLVSYESDEYYMVQLEEKSWVFTGATQEQIGKIYEFIDEENIWRVVQVGKYNEGTFQTELYFNHAEGEVPVTPLMGIPTVYDKRVIWQSPFLYSVDLLDLVVLNHSNLQVSINTCVYPYAVAIGSECKYEYKAKDGMIQKCNDGMIWDSMTEHEKICPSCEGSGLKDRRSPMGVMLLRSGNAREPGEETFKNKPLEFISPDVTALQFLEDKIAKDEAKARAILHLQTSNSTIKGTENLTATGMTLDVQAMSSFIKSVSDQVWDIYEFVIDRIGWQRYGEAYNKPVIVAPQTFEFLTAEDYMNQVAEAVKAGLPPFMVRSIILKYLQTIFYNQAESIKVFEVVTSADRILTLDSQDVAIGLAKGTIAKWEAVLHDSSVEIIEELILENTKFLELELGEKIDQLKTRAQEMTAAIPSTTPQTTTAQTINNLLGQPPK